MEILWSKPLLIVALLVGTVFVFNQVRLWRIASRVKERQQFDDSDFGRLFFPDPALSDIAVKTRSTLAEYLEMDLRGIRPEDNLDDDLNAGIGENIELLWELEKVFGIDFEVEKLDKFEKLSASVTTFSDLVHAVAERIGSAKADATSEGEKAGADWHKVIGYAWFAGLGLAVLGSMAGIEWAWAAGLIIALLPLSAGALWQAGIIAIGALSELRQVGVGPAMSHPLGLLFSVLIFTLLLAVGGGLLWVAISLLIEAWPPN